MAPGASKLGALAVGPAALRATVASYAKEFFTGPGRLKRILILLFAIFNWKNMPFAWTFRVFYTVYYHHFIRRAPYLGPRALFAPVITPSHAPLLEMDAYGFHKNNSTYFTDLDVSRSHLVSYVCRQGIRDVTNNVRAKLVLDPQGKAVKGRLNIVLGAVHCTYHREIGAYRGYELWSRILTWDRKWLVILTHFVPRGTARPSEWMDARSGKLRTSKEARKGWEKKIHATAVSKYVFKLDRLTVHPAIILNASRVLPPRPGGWVVSDALANGNAVNGDLDGVAAPTSEEWTWQKVEAQRKKGMEFADKFLAMDELQKLFEGGQGAAVGEFIPC